jgi:hypothetical protein
MDKHSSIFSLANVVNKPTYTDMTIIASRQNWTQNAKYCQGTFLVKSQLLHGVS